MRDVDSYTARPAQPHDGADVFFYELHEGDNEVFSDVLVASDSEWDPEEFFELVRVQDAHARSRCRDESGAEPWACCGCDCSA